MTFDSLLNDTFMLFFFKNIVAWSIFMGRKNCVHILLEKLVTRKLKKKPHHFKVYCEIKISDIHKITVGHLSFFN